MSAFRDLLAFIRLLGAEFTQDEADDLQASLFLAWTQPQGNQSATIQGGAEGWYDLPGLFLPRQTFDLGNKKHTVYKSLLGCCPHPPPHQQFGFKSSLIWPSLQAKSPVRASKVQWSPVQPLLLSMTGRGQYLLRTQGLGLSVDDLCGLCSVTRDIWGDNLVEDALLDSQGKQLPWPEGTLLIL